MEKICGVYKITNPIGQIYIGSSKDIHSRINKAYKCNITKRVRLINKSISMYGFENHKIDIVEICNPNILFERERFWQEELNSLYPNGLNRNLVSCPGKKQVASTTTRNLISYNKKGCKAWNKGIPTSESTKLTISNKYTPLQRKSSKLILDIFTGVYFYSLREASEAYSIPKSTLKSNLTAPNRDARHNKTTLIFV